ncbi:efflux pump azaK [Colletotrichum spaethianum]|uniref:Efflux pump azaK n=1 Tax=Colletotrichum spaethianum TaxID=700344 RepID=A0AA37NWQ5_9PEZI|nr:efflux pump azaK [Colletotrichum spaethianum]GKT44542.1 efflux pump azaK [Colletotrichum spaethianum]
MATEQRPLSERSAKGPHDSDATETTPLLIVNDVAPTADPDVAKATTLDDPDQQLDDPEDKSLPVWQIFLLCYARLVEPMAFFSIFPFVNQMAQENGNLAEADVGFYSGLIESLFSLTQAIVMISWGKLSDRIGRKPVLVFSLFGVTLATSIFGMAQTIWQMILFRCLAGVFGGTIVTMRTMIAEHSTPKTQARAFSWFAFSGNLGLFFGPLLGGVLADPARQYPGVFKSQFFLDYPYALPSFVVGFIGLTAALTSLFFVEETLKKEPHGEDDNGSALWLLVIFPPLQHRIGTNGVLRVCSYAYPFFYLISPLGNLILKASVDSPKLITFFWIFVPVGLAIGCGVSMSFTGIQLALNDVSPSPQVLGTLNALALTGASVLRAFDPALFASLFAIGVRTQYLWGYAIWFLMVALAVGLIFAVRKIPEIDNLKKVREQERAEQDQ